MTARKEKRRVAVVLSGGGAKGAYQVGALKAILSRGVEPDIYCGTSVGSFNCGMLVSGKTLGEVERVWRNMTPGAVFQLRYDPRKLLSLDPRTPMRFAFDSAKLIGGFVAESLKESGNWWEAIDLDDFLLDTSPLGELISKNIDLDALHGSRTEYSIALTQLKPVEGYPLRIIAREKITHKHILASCSLPLIFPPVVIGNQAFCDGGVVMNSPLKPAVDAGAEDIYIVDLTPPPRTYRDGTLPLAYQIMSAQFSAMLQRDIDAAMELNSRYLAAHTEGQLVEGKVQVKRFAASPDAKDETVTKRYRYLRLYLIRPSIDLQGLGGFLKFEADLMGKWIDVGEKEANSALGKHYERKIAAPNGSVIDAVFQGPAC